MAGLSINTNLGALTALRFYQANATLLDGARERVSTGLRVVGPRDDSSSFSVAQGVRADIKAWSAVDTGLSAAEGLLAVTLAAGTAISDILGELKKKVIEYSAADTARQPIIAADISALIDSIDIVAENANFAGANLITSDDVSIIVPQPPDEGALQTLSKGPGGPEDGTTHSLGAFTGTLRLNFNLTSGNGGQVRIIYNGAIVASSGLGGPNSPGALTFSYPAAPTQDFHVQITGGAKTLEYTFFLDTDVNSQAAGAYQVLSDITGANIDIQRRSMLAEDIELDAGTILDSVQAGLAQVEAAQREVSLSLGYYASKLNEVRVARQAAARFRDALTESLGSLVDADLQRESAVLTAARVRESLSLEALSLANGRPRVIVDLLEAVQASGEA
jgi:flagellin